MLSLKLNLRTIAEAAYLVNPWELKKHYKKRGTIKENYKNAINNGAYFGSLKEYGYECFDVYDNKKDGFYAAVLRSCSQKTLVAIRGTDFSDFNILLLIFGGLLGPSRLAVNLTGKIISSDLYSDLQLALGSIPNQYRSAVMFITNLLKVCPDNNLIITGHSLGGFLAQLVGVKFGLDTVVFDSPGAKNHIEKIIDKDLDLQKITIINNLPNFINTCGEHIKTPIALNNGGALCLDMVRNFFGTIPHRPGKKVKYLVSHGMEDILNSISKEGLFKQIPIKTWPKDSLAFYVSLEAYEAMPDIYDNYIYQLWKKQYDANFLDKYVFPASFISYLPKTRFKVTLTKSFRAQYPTFESYKSDFLQYGLNWGPG